MKDLNENVFWLYNYPVILLIDGSALYFDSTAEMASNLHSSGFNTKFINKCMESLIVGDIVEISDYLLLCRKVETLVGVEVKPKTEDLKSKFRKL